MQLVFIYFISFIAALGALVLWKLLYFINALKYRLVSLFLYKKLVYILITKWQKGSLDLSIFITLYILLYIVVNLVISVFRVLSRTKFVKYYSSLFIINIIPLYMGGRISLFNNKVLQFNLSQYSLLYY